MLFPKFLSRKISPEKSLDFLSQKSVLLPALCQDVCFLQWDIKIQKSKILHCKKASSKNDMSFLQCVKT